MKGHKGHCILHLKTPKISVQRAHKDAQKCEEKGALSVAVDDPLDSAIKGAAGEPEDVISNLHKDAQKGAFGDIIKSSHGVLLYQHLWLHLLIQ